MVDLVTTARQRVQTARDQRTAAYELLARARQDDPTNGPHLVICEQRVVAAEAWRGTAERWLTWWEDRRPRQAGPL